MRKQELGDLAKKALDRESPVSTPVGEIQGGVTEANPSDFGLLFPIKFPRPQFTDQRKM
jgi:hypothetical protein